MRAKGTTKMFFHTQTDNDIYLTKAEGAAELGVSPRTFDKLLPTIPHFRIGRKILIRKSELRRWLEQYRVSPNDLDLQRVANQAAEAVLGRPNPKKGQS